MSVYLVADVDVHDMEYYKRSGYFSDVPVLAAKYGGRYLVRGGSVEILEGDWEPARMVLIEFPEMKKLKAFYDSPEYAPYREIRRKVTTSKLIAVEGLAEGEWQKLAGRKV